MRIPATEYSKSDNLRVAGRSGCGSRGALGMDFDQRDIESKMPDNAARRSRPSCLVDTRNILSKKKTTPAPVSDPHAAREAKLYEKPIPSREVIVNVLEESGQLYRLTELADRLGLEGDEDLEALRRRVRAMQRDGQIHMDRRGRIGLSDRLELARCRIIGHRDGYGFASPLAEGDDFFLSARDMQLVFDGDTVLIAQTGIDHRGRPEGENRRGA